MMSFLGSGPYCYVNSLAMVLGDDSPPPSVIEVLTGSPFGMHFGANGLPYFDPVGWDPDLGLDAALDLLGWAGERTSGGSAGEALERLRAANRGGPVMVGPVDIGLLTHQPWSVGVATGTDHWLVVLEADDDTVVLHDPDGFPYATLPTAQFLAAWRADAVECGGPYALRTGFRRVREVPLTTALRESIPHAVRWLGADSTAVGRLADVIEKGIDDKFRDHLVYFAVRLGARRLADAAYWLADIVPGAAAILQRQAQLLGAIQFPLVRRDDRAAADGLRRLAPTYEQVGAALAGGR
ncbi:hypothetical protein [Actinoplanes sp. NBRC 103695]|uniref:hypothetical protein n=1 Tax=Actinoplanes sp. NBRC 103695 TaxID=3032202 RepID=UPI0024A117F6|nr:hypothetical protein [Actinoplanes sp. NBRC 103695]GLY98511.1 hypothetical protein Acsp02_57650 [Actinoplanes sp. NBRC 103695]